MLQKVEFRQKSLDDYRPIVGHEKIDEIRGLADKLKGARVLHVNATAFGGGVSEILYSLVPLMRDVGLDAEWRVIKGETEFFKVTKTFHNALQGMNLALTEEMKEIYNRYNQLNAEAFRGEYDFVVIHDPQPAALKHYLARPFGKWIWRCHIDTSTPHRAVWDFLRSYLEEYDAGIFTMAQYVGDLHFPHLALITPTIDPLVPKNRLMALEEAQSIVARFGVDVERPLVTQVSRFDPWKDPLGVIDAYLLVRKEVPGLQLALVGSMAADDPEGWLYRDRTLRHAGENFDIHILSNLEGVGDVEVGAFQSASDVVVQKSTREGFGLVVAEALWKGRPVVGSRVGGIPLQVVDGQTGYLVSSVEECAEKILYLLQHPEESKWMGERGREHVRQNFLITRYLRDYLQLFNSLC